MNFNFEISRDDCILCIFYQKSLLIRACMIIKVNIVVSCYFFFFFFFFFVNNAVSNCYSSISL